MESESHDENTAFSTLMFDESERALLGQAQIGIEAEKFLATAPGRAVVARARESVLECLRLAISEDFDLNAFKKAREKAMAAKTSLNWLLDEVQTGHEAERQLGAR